MKLFIKIVRESIFVLIIAALLSSIGGIALKSVEASLVTIVPLIIILPALNDMIGDFGIILVSRFTTALYMHKKTKIIAKHLFKDVLLIALISAIYIALLGTLFSPTKGFSFDIAFLLKMIILTLITTFVLVLINFFIALFAGKYVYKKKIDPDDVLIPLTTSIADLGAMIVLALLVLWLF
ncbi:MAG: magnesium transporter [Candidatus Pacearchaeota archaeon]|nr:magnesium transporter [Candidatus Pacearchaeota archaeon]